MGLRRGWTAALALSILCALLVSQAAYFGASHHHDDDGHCCTLCHVRNVPPLQALAVFRLPQPILIEWALASDSLPAAAEPPAIAGSSRSPPA
jgi:hypothetical protein